MRLVVIMLVVVLAGLALLEALMQPSSSERLELGLIFGAMAILVLIAVKLLPRLAERTKSIRLTMGLLGISGITIIVLGILAASSRMFLSEHDLRLLLVVLAFGALAAVTFAVTVSRPLSSDIDALSRKASHIAQGHLDPVMPIGRRDEIGRLGKALGQMIERLEDAELAREAGEEARRVFFSSVGHDLRTPLASLRASLEAIQDGVADDPSRSLEIMGRDIAALTRLVDDLNLLARLDSGALDLELTQIDVTEVADEAIDVLRPLAASRGISLHLDANERVTASGHAGHVGRAVRNLIDNAIRHAPDSSQVTVAVARRNGSAVALVIDDGPGFDPEFVPSAFDRFSRGDRSRPRETGGSGLGLAIVQSLVGALGGRVWIDDGPGGRVGIELPLEPSPPHDSDRAGRHPPNNARNRASPVEDPVSAR